MKKGMQVLMGLALVLGVVSVAESAVLDFESLRHDDDQIVEIGAVYEESGFRLTATAPDSSLAPSFATAGTELDYVFTGSTALINDNWEGTTILMRTDGGLFQMNSIDLAELFATGEPFTVTFTGLLGNGDSVFQTFNLDGLLGTETFVFDTDFTDLVAVSWLQGDYLFHQFDNIDVTPINAAPIPEPATLLLFGAGLLVVTAVGRRK
ncbi:MAG: PEP-CTERM sorting domain-containing protein [Desulfobulbus sp.]|nr:PEP-CTERM sorting domain-containing protein [Desulfobulbus sp.]